MDRLSILCFAGTYALALLSDLGRFVVRGTWQWYATVTLAVVAWAVHTAYLATNVFRDHGLRIMSQYEFLIVLSWVFATIAVYLMLRVPRTVAVGVFVLPVVVALSAMAGITTRPEWSNWSEWAPVWGAVHGWFLSLGAVLTCVAFVAGLMYLAQSSRLKRKQPPFRGFALPSLEQTERLNRVAITLAFPLLTLGLLIGVVLNLEGLAATGAMVLRWSDPKILSAGAMWLVFAVLLHARFRPAMRGRRVVWLSIVAFGFLLFAMVGVNWILPTAHGLPGTGGGPP
jgi:ABC-type transport system involved in cytochrome c biogenesis permease subunit